MHELVLLLTGFIVGAMNAVAGGGMLVGFPVLISLGLSPLVASATAPIISAPGQLASTWGYRSYIRHIPKRFAILIIPLVVGAYFGATALRNTNPEHFAEIVPLLVLFGVALFTLQPFIHLHLRQHLHGKRRTIAPLLVISIAVLPVAFYGAYFGPGYGFMMLAFLSFTRLHDIHVMNAIKNISSVFVSVTALLCLYTSGLVDWHTGLIAAVGAIIGGYLGARGSQKLNSHWLRILVIVIGFAAVIYLALMRY